MTEEHKQSVVEDVEYWKEQTQIWLSKRTTKEDYELIGICGQVVVEFGRSWNESNVKAAGDDMKDQGIPVARIDDEQIRIDATDERIIL
jgi:hypothetical protein